MEIEQYLKRIKYSGDLIPNFDLLKELHKTHLYHVPFENLDIHYQRHIELDSEKIYRKIVLNNRGGFCYELNGLFYQLLKKLQFQAIMVSARVFKEEIGYTPEFDHCAIIVKIDNNEFLVDVGFGEFIFEPLKLDFNLVQKDTNGEFFIDQYNSHYRVNKIIEGQTYPSYIFKKKSRDLSEFKDRCNFQQYHPDSHFKSKKMISKPTRNGRITISGNTIKIREKDEVTEKKINDESEFIKQLENLFNTNLNSS